MTILKTSNAIPARASVMQSTINYLEYLNTVGNGIIIAIFSNLVQ